MAEHAAALLLEGAPREDAAQIAGAGRKIFACDELAQQNRGSAELAGQRGRALGGAAGGIQLQPHAGAVGSSREHDPLCALKRAREHVQAGRQLRVVFKSNSRDQPPHRAGGTSSRLPDWLVFKVSAAEASGPRARASRSGWSGKQEIFRSGVLPPRRQKEL